MNTIKTPVQSLLVLLVVSGWSIPVAGCGEERNATLPAAPVTLSEADLQAFMRRWATYQSFEVPDDAKDEPLLLAALKKAPAGPWAAYLGHKFATAKYKARKLAPAERARQYRETLNYLAPARETLKQAAETRPADEILRFWLHEIELAAALASLEAGENLGVMKERLEALLRTGSPDEGNLVYHANSTLGRLALREGDVGEAKRRLVAAGQTPGSPQLNSFGPDFILARELLEKHEHETVLSFLDAVERFWAARDVGAEANSKRSAEANLANLDSWRKQIRSGKIPDDSQWK